MKKTRTIYLIIGLITAYIAFEQDMTFDKKSQKASFGRAEVITSNTKSAQPQSSLTPLIHQFALNHLASK